MEPSTNNGFAWIQEERLVGIFNRRGKPGRTDDNTLIRYGDHYPSLPESERSEGGSTLTFVKDLRPYAKQTAQWAMVVATIVVLFRVGRRHQTDLTQIDLRLNLGWLPLAAIATVTANLLLPLGWRRIMHRSTTP